mgnify:FL=1
MNDEKPPSEKDYLYSTGSFVPPPRDKDCHNRKFLDGFLPIFPGNITLHARCLAFTGIIREKG